MPERLFVRLEGDPGCGPETPAPRGALTVVPVDARLRGYVDGILGWREVVPTGAVLRERVLPDGVVHLSFHFGDAPMVDGTAVGSAAVIGSSMQPAIVGLRGRVDGLTVALRPGAAAALLGVPAGALNDQAVALDELWGDDGGELRERMSLAASTPARARILQELLVRRLSSTDARIDRGVRAAMQQITASRGRVTVRALAADLGVTERRLQQRFHADVGLSPRAWRRLARLHACLRDLRAPSRPPWSSVAAEAAFYDQAHLANEFRALVGLTPTEFVAGLPSDPSKTVAAPGATVAP